jgi:hypothetical protein
MVRRVCRISDGRDSDGNEALPAMVRRGEAVPAVWRRTRSGTFSTSDDEARRARWRPIGVDWATHCIHIGEDAGPIAGPGGIEALLRWDQHSCLCWQRNPTFGG